MNLHQLGIKVTSMRKVGRMVDITCSLDEAQLRCLLEVLPIGADISAPDPESGDCFREVRRAKEGLELKRGCHGSYGTWRAGTPDNALQWLSAGLAVLPKVAKPGYGVGITIPDDAYEG